MLRLQLSKSWRTGHISTSGGKRATLSSRYDFVEYTKSKIEAPFPGCWAQVPRRHPSFKAHRHPSTSPHTLASSNSSLLCSTYPPAPHHGRHRRRSDAPPSHISLPNRPRRHKQLRARGSRRRGYRNLPLPSVYLLLRPRRRLTQSKTEQDDLIKTLAAKNTSTNATYTHILLALPLLTTAAYIPALLRPSAAAPVLPSLLALTSLFSTAFHHGWGTLYTAVYRPADGAADYLWPGRTLQQSFDRFEEVVLDVALFVPRLSVT
jgi:hypothetical protein